MLDRRPLVAAHRARAGVGEQVDQHVVGVQVEQVVARVADAPRALLAASSCASGSTEWMRNGSMMVRNSTRALYAHRAAGRVARFARH